MESRSRDTQWYVIHTQPRKEELAALNLLNQSYEIFLPRCHNVRYHARKKTVVISPLFPRYLFVKIDLAKDHWLPIDSTRGVAYIIRQRNGQPVPMPGNLVEELQSRQVENKVVPLSSLVLFKPGEKVQILEGSFLGNVAFYEKMTGEERVQVLLDILGRDVRVDLSIHQVASL